MQIEQKLNLNFKNIVGKRAKQYNRFDHKTVFMIQCKYKQDWFTGGL